jgi:Reverse transcriptase (RNA-dependent DNA polymerase)
VPPSDEIRSHQTDRPGRHPGSLGPRRTRERLAIATFEIVRPGGGIRTMTRLDPDDEIALASAVSRLVPRIEAALSSTVFANRTRRTSSNGIALSPWMPARRRFEHAVDALVAIPRTTVFIGDVRSCYGSITPDVVEKALVAGGGPSDDVERLITLLRDLEDRGTRGLPIGPPASAPLANAVLTEVDRALQARAVALRWVDDVIAVAESRRDAVRISDSFHRALARLGLEANPSKTRILGDAEPSPTVRLRSPVSSCASPLEGHAMMRAP